MTATVPACPECGRRCLSCATKIAAAGVDRPSPPVTPAADEFDADQAPPHGIVRPDLSWADWWRSS